VSRTSLWSLILCVWVGVSLVAATTLPPNVRIAGIQLTPCATKVGLAKVYLEVSQLRLTGNELTGSYAIRVPLLPYKNETGTIRLETPASLEQLETIGGRLTGSARSDDDETRVVNCEVDPHGTIRIDIATGQRTLSFNTEYEVSGGS